MKTRMTSLAILVTAAALTFSACSTSDTSIPPTAMSFQPTATPIPPTIPPVTPTMEEGISIEQAMEEANQAFSNCLLVYIYDPQPQTISISSIEGYAELGFRYIVSDDAQEVSSIFVVQYVDLEGNRELKRFTFTDIDWSTRTGSITFHKDPMGAVIEQALQSEGIGTKNVTPEYIEVSLMGLEQQGDLTVIGSQPLSNTIRFQIVP